MKLLVKKTKNGVHLIRIRENKDELSMMDIELKDGDIVTDEQKPYPLIKIESLVGDK